MNAAFLLVTTAWLAGAEPAPPAIQPAAFASGGCASCGSSCGSCCEASCESCGCGGGFFSKLKGKFHHKSECGCETSCSTCAPAPAPTCDTCGTHHKIFEHKQACGCEAAPSCTSCAAAPTCGTCDSCGTGHCGGGRLKGLFHHKSSCGCETDCGCAASGCSSCGESPAVISGPAAMPATPAPGTKVEPIKAPKEQPKKMPSEEPKKETETIYPVPAAEGNGGATIEQ